MEGEAETLRAEVKRYNRLRASTVDASTREALEFLITKAEARLRDIKAVANDR
jgi:hypothetical protein